MTDVTSDIAGSTTQNDYNLANHLVKFDGKNVVTDKIGKPQTVGTQELSYDSLGNRTSSTDTTNPTTNKTYDWSVDNLLNHTDTTASEVGYQYDSSGLISKRTENSQTDDFLWDETATNALLLTDGDYEYVYGANRVPLAQVDLADNSIDYLHTDINGSVIAVTNDTGHLDGITNYGAYGKRQGSAISRYGYAGEWTDPTTTYTYLRARWYDPSTGSFLSKDPLYELTQEAYGYANGNPLLNIDPSGLFVDNLGLIKYVTQEKNETPQISPMHQFLLDNTTAGGAQKASNISAGIGDAILLGSGPTLIKFLGIENAVETCSPEYNTSNIVTEIGTYAIPGVNAGKIATTGVNATKSVKNSLSSFSWQKTRANLLNRDREFGGAFIPKLTSKTERKAYAKEIAEKLGMIRKGGTSSSAPIFYDKNSKMYYTADITSHNGGVFKGAKKPEDLMRKTTRAGTYDEDLNRMKG